MASCECQLMEVNLLEEGNTKRLKGKEQLLKFDRFSFDFGWRSSAGAVKGIVFFSRRVAQTTQSLLYEYSVK